MGLAHDGLQGGGRKTTRRCHELYSTLEPQASAVPHGFGVPNLVATNLEHDFAQVVIPRILWPEPRGFTIAVPPGILPVTYLAATGMICPRPCDSKAWRLH